MDIIKEGLKGEIGDLLHNYRIPMEDRELVFEKIDGILESSLNEERQFFAVEIGKVKAHIDSERDSIRQELTGMRQSAQDSEVDWKGRIDAAYAEGLKQGLAAHEHQPSMIPVLVGLGLLTLAMVLVANKIFSKE